MSKELTTRERNEIIGLAIDYNSDAYNEALDFIYEKIDFICGGNKADGRILAALVVVSTIDNINQIEKFDTVQRYEDTDRYSWYRWDRIVGQESYVNGKVSGGIQLCDNSEQAQESFKELVA